MEKLMQILSSIFPSSIKLPTFQISLEDDYEMEEYHNPYLGLCFSDETLEV